MLADAINRVYSENTVAFLQIFVLEREYPGFRLIISTNSCNLMENSQSLNYKREKTTTYWYLTSMATDTPIWAGGTGSCLLFLTLVQHWKGRQGKLFLETHDITKEAFWDSKSTARAAFTLLLLSHSLSSGTSPVKASASSIFSSRLPLSPQAGCVPASVRGLTAGVGWCDTHKCCIEESLCISLHSERWQVIQSWGCDEEEDNST